MFIIIDVSIVINCIIQEGDTLSGVNIARQLTEGLGPWLTQKQVGGKDMRNVAI